jgi:hypothetical protein
MAIHVMLSKSLLSHQTTHKKDNRSNTDIQINIGFHLGSDEKLTLKSPVSTDFSGQYQTK